MSTVALTNGLADADLLLESVRAQLARPRGERPSEPTALDGKLGDLGQRLRSAVCAEAAVDPATAAAMLELVYETAELRNQLRERELSERLEVLARIRESMEQLRECASPEELIEAAPAEACRACGFSRVLISQIRGGKWVPVLIEAIPGRDPQEDAFKAWVEQAVIPLEHMLIETELVRRRMPALVSDPVHDRRAPREVVARGRTVAYVATPIISDGRAIGFLHADRIGQPEQVTAEDRDTIWSFAEQFGLIYQRAVLVERLVAQRTQLHDAFVAAERVVEELRESELKLARTPHRTAEVASAAALFRPEESRLAALLTRRELEVMELITSGATNVRIGEQLVISEGTVKSHVKHILRKLRVGNRSEAVARYLQLVKRDHDEAGR
jgi:DNA-binding CsgD family transcriptional regulator